MRKLYACILYVEGGPEQSEVTTKLHGLGVVVSVKTPYRAAPFVALADSEEEAVRGVLARGREQCQPKDGWHSHEAHAMQIDDDLIRKAYQELTNA